MFIRPCYRRKKGKRHAYWALVESYRTERGPRQRVIAYLGQVDKKGRLGVKRAAEGNADFHQGDLFEKGKTEWVEVDVSKVRVENRRDFGCPWLGLELVRRLGLNAFLDQTIPPGREEIPWSLMVLVLVLCRLCEPSSELYIAEHFYSQSALSDLLGIPDHKVNEDRLYRALDALLPHKEALEGFLKDHLGDLFDLKYDLLLYDVTSTYFEGEACRNPQARYGHSRDKRPDCKQVCIGLVVSKEGFPLGYEVFPGNRADVTTLPEIVEAMERRYGRADRIWVGDRGMVSEKNIAFLRDGKRRYIVGTPRSMLKQFERKLMEKDWQTVHSGLEVKLCPSPGGEETFILCRSQDRREKEKQMHARFERRIEEGLKQIEESCRKRKNKVVSIAQRLGRLMTRNSRAAGLFKTEIKEAPDGRAILVWKKEEAWRAWADLSEGCYLLRSNVTEWTGEDLWKAYIQLTEAEAAFRIHKSDLKIRPVWHQKEDPVQAHILVCFLAYVLWKTLEQLCRRAGLGDEPRRLFDELSKISVVDVVLPTRNGMEIRKSCVTRPTEHQEILLQRLKLRLPSHIKIVCL